MSLAPTCPATTAAVPFPAHTSRGGLVVELLAGLDPERPGWAVQGADGAVERWAAAEGLADLDLWVAADERDRAARVLERLAGVRLHVSDRPPRLRHERWLLTAGGRPAIVDLTIGDLRVGPRLLCAGTEVSTAPAPSPFGPARRLTGPALVADLVARPLLRGRAPDPARLAEAGRAWSILPEAHRARPLGLLRPALGRAGTQRLQAALAGASATDGNDAGDTMPLVARAARRRLAAATLAPRAIRSTWHDRHTILPARGPFGLPSTGVVLALVGTDGSGKSTASAELESRLARLGVPVSTAYFGMARGNLPGLATARRLARRAGQVPADDSPVIDGRTPTATAGGRAGRALREAAAWAYAADYVWRAARLVPARRRGAVVVCDRWVTDLRRQPAPGSPAARMVERLVGPPDVLALADAPIEVIHARKPERSLADARDDQRSHRAVAAELAARTTVVVLDTSGADPDPVAALIRAVLRAAHPAGES
jgi:thymidylate kinase